MRSHICRDPADMKQDRTTVVLDADGFSKLARGDRRVREMIHQEVVAGTADVAVPWVAVMQALVEGAGQRAVERVIDAIGMPTGLDRERAQLGAQLLRDSRTTDLPDALVAVEALRCAPSIVITSDPDDIRRLLDEDPQGVRVAVWGV